MTSIYTVKSQAHDRPFGLSNMHNFNQCYRMKNDHIQRAVHGFPNLSHSLIQYQAKG